MASAVLASQNESSWAHMGNNPYSNPNPNPNPKKKQKQFYLAAANGHVGSRFHGSNNMNHNLDSPVVTQTASDDAYSFNQTSTSRNAANYGGYLSFNVAAFSKFELVELRKRLSVELDQIRDLQNRIEIGQLNGAANPRSQPKLKKFPGNKRPSALAGSVPKKSLSLQENGSLNAINFEGLLKECGKIVAKLIKHKFGYIFKMPVDAVALGLHDYHLIVKRPMDLGTVKTNLAKSFYRTPMEFAADMRLIFNNALLYNPKNDPVNGMASQLLDKFEELFRPVQVSIDSTMGKQQREMEVNEDRYINDESQFRAFDELQGSSCNNPVNHSFIPSPVRKMKCKPKASPVPIAEDLKKPDKMQDHSSASTASNPPPPMNQMDLMPMPMPEPFLPSPVRAPSPLVKEQKAVKGVGPVKLPKPKAKDPNKRDMNMEEKHKLGMGLQSLPQEKMPQLVQIIRKRNKQLAHDGDEIELDIETLDNETLWELDRFVTNWKKMVSKSKRQALLNNPLDVEVAPPTNLIADTDMGALSDKNDDGDDAGKKVKENDDEDVDIDDDMPTDSFPPVEIEKDEGAGGDVCPDQYHNPEPGGDRPNASSSSSSSGSSSSDSSSSSGSDSGSSSGSDSDADDAQS